MRWTWTFLAALLIAGPAPARVALAGDLPRRDGRPLQAITGLETEYGAVRTSEGLRLRTILTRPEGASAPLPAIFFVQWVSCGTLDFAADRPSQLRELARRSGMVLIRVERSGTGDSEGAPCSALDYDTELRHYREALDQLSGHRWVDGERIVLFGSSLGTTMASLVAQGRRIAGILVQGGGGLTYVERMINFDRLQIERSGDFPPEARHAEMLRRIAFHHDYLIRGLSPSRIEAERPELAGVSQRILGLSADGHYGRPFAWHQQAARHDFLAAWTRIDAPVMVVHGEFDQYEPADGHRLIADTVNRLRPGTATYVEIAGADHDLDIYESAEAAYRGEGGEQRFDLFLEPVLAWLARLDGR